MAAINFPDSPSNGTTHTVGGTTWTYNSTLGVWEITSSASTATSIDDLADVDITTAAPTANQTLLWNAATSNFIPGTVTGYSNADVTAHLASFDGSIIPAANVTYDLGSATNRFRDLYISGNSINLGDVQLSANNGGLAVTSNSGGGSTASFATQDYVTTQITNLVDSAPGALDTLNELAAALGDDANFATTVTNQIAAKANTADLATVATSGSYADLSNKPTIPTAASVVEYTSTNTAAVNDVVMLNTDGTVTVVEPTNYAFNQQTAINSAMTSGLVGQNSYRAMIAHHSTREKAMLLFPGGTGHNDYNMLVMFTRSGSTVSTGNAFSTGNHFFNRDPHAFFGPAGTYEDTFLYLSGRTAGSGTSFLKVGTVTGTTINGLSNLSGGDGTVTIGHTNNECAFYHGGFSGNVLTLYAKFENSNGKAALRKFTYDFANQTFDTSYPEIETSSSEVFEWEHTAVDPATPTRIALYRQEGSGATRKGIIKFATVDWDAGTISLGPSADLFTRSGTENVPVSEIQNHQEFHPTNGLLAAVTTTPPDAGGDAPYRLKVALYSADSNLNITNSSGNSTLISGSNGAVAFVKGNICWTKGTNTGSSPNAPSLIIPAKNPNESEAQTIYVHYDNSGNEVSKNTTWSNQRFPNATNKWIYSSPFNDGDTAQYSIDSSRAEVTMTQGAYGESNFDAAKLHGLAVSSGTTIDVTLEYGIHSGLSNLTTGSKYFVSDSGAIGTSGVAKLGTAINSTSLSLDFTDELTSTDLGTYATQAYVASQLSPKANTADLANVATSGSYTDLSNKPALANVATSGSYNDLINQPTLFDGQYSSLTGAPTIPNEALVVEYVSTTSASINDVVMLNANNTVTPVVPTNYPFVSNKGTANMTAGGYDNNAVSGDAVVTYGTATVDKFFGIWVEGNIWRGSFHTNSSGSYSFGTEYNFSSYYDGTIDLDPTRGSEPYVLNSTVNNDRILLIGTSSSGQGNRIVSLQGTISGTAITWDGNLVTHPSYGTNSGDEGYSSAGHFITYDYAGSTSSVDKLIMEYSDVDGNRKLMRIEWDGTTLTYGTPISVTGKSDFAFDAITEGRFVARSGTTDIIGGLVTWSSSTVTFGGALLVHSSLGNMKLGIDPLSGKIAGAWNVASSPWGSYLTQYSMDGTYSITSVGGFQWDSVSSSWSSRPDFLKFAKNSSSFIVSYLDKDSSYYGQYRVWSIDGTTFATVQGASNLPYRHSGSTFGTTANLQDNPHHSGQIAMAYEEWQLIAGADKYYYRTKHTQLAYSESNINVSTIHGVAASAGTTINVTLENGIHTSFSNLSVGSKYFVLENGTISTSADANQAKLGEAISNTHLALDFTDEASSSSLSVYPLASSLSTVATSGSYTDLSNKPTLANVATSGSYTDLTGTPAAGLSIHANQAAMLTDAASATEGTLHYETDTNKLYVKQSSGFYLLASITNVAPTIDSFSENTDGAGANDLTSGGTLVIGKGLTTVITINATEPDLETISYSATVTSGTVTDVFASPSFPVTTQSSNVFNLTTVTSGSGGTVTIRFDATDGTNIANVTHSFELSFIVANSKYTSLLMTTDNSNGDNDSFTDSSTNNQTLTAYNGPYAGTFSPYRQGGYSAYFDGSGDYLTPGGTGVGDFGTGDFTVEFWMKTTAGQSTATNIINSAATGTGNWGIMLQSNMLRWNDAYTVTNLWEVDVTNELDDNWHHIAIVRSSGTQSVYVDGVSRSASSGTFTDSADYTGVGAYRIGLGNGNNYSGYLTDVRIVKGSAIIPPSGGPSARLTDVTGTSLLTCHLPYFADGSSNARTITISGDPETRPEGPYNYPEEYSEANNGGSIYFSTDDNVDGSYITSSSYVLGDPATINFWMYPIDSTQKGSIIDSDGAYTTANEFQLWFNGTLYLNMRDSSTTYKFISANLTFPYKVWTYVSLVREDEYIKFYFNGVLKYTENVGTGQFPFNLGHTTYIGRRRYSDSFSPFSYWPYVGYLSDMQFIGGTAVTPTPSTIPTAPPSAHANEEFRLLGADAHVIDKAQRTNLLLTGSVVSTNTVSKFANTNSVYFDGSGDAVTVPSLGLSGDLTIETWLYQSTTQTNAYRTILSSSTYGSGVPLRIYTYGASVQVWLSSAGSAEISGSFTANTWHHIALVRSSGTWTLYIDGQSQGTDTTGGSYDFASTTEWTIGSRFIGSSAVEVLTGYLQDLRLSEGLARYTSSFTPPSAPLEG